MPVQHQLASAAAWNNEQHVIENRALYREKFDAIGNILKDVLPIEIPEAGFYFWAKTPICDMQFSRDLFSQHNVTVLPGQFLSRSVDGVNPGQNYVRMALVAPLDKCIEAAQRIKQFMANV